VQSTLGSKNKSSVVCTTTIVLMVSDLYLQLLVLWASVLNSFGCVLAYTLLVKSVVSSNAVNVPLTGLGPLHIVLTKRGLHYIYLSSLLFSCMAC